MNLKIENWKLLLLSIFYVIFAILSYSIPKAQYNNFFRIAGIIIALVGLFQILVYFFKKEYMKPNEFSFAFGMLYMMAGLIVMSKSDVIVNNYPYVISGVVALDSTLRMQYAMNLFRLQDSKWKVNVIFAIVPLVLALCLILIPMDEVIVRNYFSFLLILDAVANFYTVLYYKQIVKKFATQGYDMVKKEEVEDVEIIK